MINYRKMVLVLLMASGTCGSVSAQTEDPVHFTYTVKKIGEKQFELHVIAAMDEGWHIYAQVQPKQAVSQPTKILFIKNPLILISGKPWEIGKKEKYEDKVVGIVQYQFLHTLELVQPFTLKAGVKTHIAGTITYEACTEDHCLPVTTISFDIPVNPSL